MTPLDHLARLLDEKDAIIARLQERVAVVAQQEQRLEALRIDRDVQADTVRARTQELEELERSIEKAASTLLRLFRDTGGSTLVGQAIRELGQGHLIEEHTLRAVEGLR